MALLRGVGSGVRTMMKEGLGGEKYGIVEGRGEWGANHDEGRVGGGKYGIVEGRGESGANHDEGRVGGGEVWYC